MCWAGTTGSRIVACLLLPPGLCNGFLFHFHTHMCSAVCQLCCMYVFMRETGAATKPAAAALFYIAETYMRSALCIQATLPQLLCSRYCSIRHATTR